MEQWARSIVHGRLYRWTENSFPLVKVTNMRRELQSQNRVDSDYEKTTGPIYLKFRQKFLLMSTTEIQKERILAAKLTDLWLLIFQS